MLFNLNLIVVGDLLISASSETETLPPGFHVPNTCFLWIMTGVLLLRSVVLGVVLHGKFEGVGALWDGG